MARSRRNSKKSSRRKSRSPKISRRRSRRVSAGRRKCNQILSAKIEKNMKELAQGRYVNRAQAIAVSYSQVKKSHPKCRRYFTRK